MNWFFFNKTSQQKDKLNRFTVLESRNRLSTSRAWTGDGRWNLDLDMEEGRKKGLAKQGRKKETTPLLLDACQAVFNSKSHYTHLACSLPLRPAVHLKNQPMQTQWKKFQPIKPQEIFRWTPGLTNTAPSHSWTFYMTAIPMLPCHAYANM